MTLVKIKLWGIYCILKNTNSDCLLLNTTTQGVIEKNFLGGGSTKKCDHNCDQTIIKSSWGSV